MKTEDALYRKTNAKQVFVELYFDMEDADHPIITLCVLPRKNGKPPTQKQVLRALELRLRNNGWGIE